MEKLRIFISSTMDDLQEERMAVADAINENKFWESVNAESFVARTESPKEVCLEEVRNSRIYIGIFKDRYGHVPPNDNPEGYSAVALEYYEAKNNRIPTFIFIDKNDSKREKKLIEFIKVIEDFNEGHWRREYSTTDELVQSTIEAVNHEITRKYIETTNVKRKTEIREIYELPYFKGLKERLR
jgi:hypothetical protein